MLNLLPRPADPPTRPLECVVFAWIGQSFSSCDDCGRPISEHLYHPPIGAQKPLFYVRQRRYRGWVWEPVGEIIPRHISRHHTYHPLD